MEKLKVLFLILVFVFSLASCNNQSIEAPEFSYEEESIKYTDNTAGIKHDGFNNTSKSTVKTVENAIERAKNECTVEWDTADVYYDCELNVWKVHFYTKGTDEIIQLGGDQCIYLDDNGKTLLIVYGE